MVYVVMSTYNGEKYLKEQIDSILDQTYTEIRIIIRDDGSTDSTVDIIEEYANKYENICYYLGENIGVANSFYDLLKQIPDDVDYIAFSDQDDVWFPNKIEDAVSRLKYIDVPALYCSRTQLVDANLNLIEDGLRKKTPRITFGNAVIENVCTGCTMVINRRLYRGIKSRLPQNSIIHDWWIYMVAVCFGRVVYSDVPHIYYRQHGGNEIGLDNNRLDLIKRQVTSLKKFRGKYTAQLYEFIETFQPKGENGYLARLVAGTSQSIICRLRVLFDRRIYRQGEFDTILFKLMLFLGML